MKMEMVHYKFHLWITQKWSKVKLFSQAWHWIGGSEGWIAKKPSRISLTSYVETLVNVLILMLRLEGTSATAPKDTQAIPTSIQAAKVGNL